MRTETASPAPFLQSLLLPLLLPLLAALGGPGGCVDADDLPIAEQREGIVGGQPTRDYPEVGALTYDGEPFCTGTVIGPRTVLTAAHCLVDFTPGSVRFVLGADARRPELVLGVAQLRPHPDFGGSPPDNDVGVVTLAGEVPVAPVELLEGMDASFVGQPLRFVGYGVSNGIHQTGAGLKRVIEVPLTEVGERQFTYSQAAGGTCNGDSGGPAFASAVDGTLLLAGVTSYGDIGCTRYGVDTRVDAYAAFIEQAAAEGVSQSDPPPREEEVDDGLTDVPGVVLWEQEPNASRSTATRLDEPSTALGRIGSVGDVDWFRLVLPGGATLQLRLAVPVDLDYDLALYDASGQRLLTSEQGAGQAETLTWSGEAGQRSRVLYVKIFGYEGSYSGLARYRATFAW